MTIQKNVTLGLLVALVLTNGCQYSRYRKLTQPRDSEGLYVEANKATGQVRMRILSGNVRKMDLDISPAEARRVGQSFVDAAAAAEAM